LKIVVLSSFFERFGSASSHLQQFITRKSSSLFEVSVVLSSMFVNSHRNILLLILTKYLLPAQAANNWNDNFLVSLINKFSER